MRLLNGDDAHLHGDETAIHFDGTEGEIHIGLSAKSGKETSLFDSADDAIHASARGKQQLIAKIDGIGDHGDKGVSFSCHGGADSSQKSEMNLRALHDLARLGKGRWRGGANERSREKKRQNHFH